MNRIFYKLLHQLPENLLLTQEVCTSVVLEMICSLLKCLVHFDGSVDILNTRTHIYSQTRTYTQLYIHHHIQNTYVNEKANTYSQTYANIHKYADIHTQIYAGMLTHIATHLDIRM